MLLVAISELGDIFFHFYFASLGLTVLKSVIGPGISMSPRSRYLFKTKTAMPSRAECNYFCTFCMQKSIACNVSLLMFAERYLPLMTPQIH